MKAQEILLKAKMDIINFILFESKKLADVFKWEYDLEDDGIEFDVEDDLDGVAIGFDISVSDTYDMEYYDEFHYIKTIIIGEDGLLVILDNEAEYTEKDLSVEVLAKIANAFEEQYMKEIKK